MMKKYICPTTHISDSALHFSVLSASDQARILPESGNGGDYQGGVDHIPGGPGSGSTGNGDDLAKQRGFYSAYGNEW